MSNKKAGVKRTGKGGKRSGEGYKEFMSRRIDEECSLATNWGKIIEQEHLLIALKRIGILGDKRMAQLSEELKKVYAEYLELALDDNEADKHLVYTKAKFDEELACVLGDYALPWDIRHNLYMRTTGIRAIDMIEQAVDIRAQLGKSEGTAMIRRRFMEIDPEIQEVDFQKFFKAVEIEEKKREKHGRDLQKTQDGSEERPADGRLLPQREATDAERVSRGSGEETQRSIHKTKNKAD